MDDKVELDDLARQLDAVEAAMARLDEGSYGTCERCGETLGPAVLEADPTGSACAACAETRLDG
jgi:RNA polymerase-binding transcription factor DksA